MLNHRYVKSIRSFVRGKALRPPTRNVMDYETGGTPTGFDIGQAHQMVTQGDHNQLHDYMLDAAYSRHNNPSAAEQHVKQTHSAITSGSGHPVAQLVRFRNTHTNDAKPNRGTHQVGQLQPGMVIHFPGSTDNSHYYHVNAVEPDNGEEDYEPDPDDFTSAIPHYTNNPHDPHRKGPGTYLTLQGEHEQQPRRFPVYNNTRTTIVHNPGEE